MTRYQLSIHAERLPNGWFRKPNPYAVVTVCGGPREGEKLGQTEVVLNSVDPDFTRVLFLDTDATVNLPLKVSIHDDRTKNSLGEAKYEATEVSVAPGHTQKQKSPNGAKIYASVEVSMKGTSRGTLKLHLRGLDIKNVEPGLMGLGRSDPFFEVSRKNADHAAGVVRWNTIYRSEHINDHLNPFWEPTQLSLEEACYGDLEWPIKVTVFDFERNGKHRSIGQFETTVSVLMSRVSIRGNADRERAFEITGEEKIQTRGLIVILQADVELDSSS